MEKEHFKYAEQPKHTYAISGYPWESPWKPLMSNLVSEQLPYPNHRDKFFPFS